MVSPYINRFLSPDTIIPNLYNPQSLNRFSYVTNNPIRYTDPTGHRLVEDFGNGGCSTSGYCPGSSGSPYTPTSTGGNGLSEDEDPDVILSGNDGSNPLVEIFDKITTDDFQALEDNGCFTHGPETIDWTNSKCIDAASFLFQDIATLSSSASATWTATLTILGCGAAFLTEGVSCAAGYALGFADHLMFFNPLESTASTISLFLTTYSDYLTHDTSLVDWRVGEDTRTGAATWVAGLAVEPFTDAAIDIYASGYNHGYFCGISTVASCLASMASNFP